jgi:DNA processing protein
VADEGQFAERTIPWALALSLLRFGADTLASRRLKELDPERQAAAPDLQGRLADAFALAPADRPARFAKASQRAADAIRTAGSALAPLAWFDVAYPELLWQITDPPFVLWCAGDPAHLSRPAIAIVGSRKATPAGVMIAARLASGLADAGFVVVSGMARGIDAAAHRAALDAGGASVAVLGCGADVVYPREHVGLAARLRESGAIVSEFPPGTPPLAHHFPLRNRIISGLCAAIVVVEASQRSGSLITARAALEQGREVLAVPGTVTSGQYSGCHALIKDGAALVETVDDVLGALGWARPAPPAASEDVNASVLNKLEKIMAVGEPYTVDDLETRSGLTGGELLAELGALEIAGLVARVPGGGFVKFDKSAIGEGNG